MSKSTSSHHRAWVEMHSSPCLGNTFVKLLLGAGELYIFSGHSFVLSGGHPHSLRVEEIVSQLNYHHT